MSEVSFPPPPPPPSPNQSAGMPPVAQRRGNGRLTAAGVLQIIEGALTVIAALWMFSVTQSEIGGFADDLTGGSITFVAALLLALGIALIWTAILCIKARKGGWVSVVVFQSIFGVLAILGVFGAASEGSPVGGGVFSAAYCGIAVFLAATGGKQSQA